MAHLSILAVVMVIRYFSLDTGNLVGVTMSYGWTLDSCMARKALIDPQPDPKGTSTSIDCVDEDEVPDLLQGARKI